MFSPIKTLYTYFPLTFFLRVLLLVLIDVAAIYIVIRLYKKAKVDKRTAVISLLLVFYILIVLFVTVLGRRTQNFYRYNFDIIESYTILFVQKDLQRITEAVLNVLMFIPIGAVMSFLSKIKRLLLSSLTGLGISLLIEILQLLLRNGYCEITDLLHNTLGAIIGSVLFIVVMYVHNHIKMAKTKVG